MPREIIKRNREEERKRGVMYHSACTWVRKEKVLREVNYEGYKRRMMLVVSVKKAVNKASKRYKNVSIEKKKWPMK